MGRKGNAHTLSINSSIFSCLFLSRQIKMGNSFCLTGIMCDMLIASQETLDGLKICFLLNENVMFSIEL